MTTIPFTKVVGSGNDFILLDARGRGWRLKPSDCARRWCDRKGGIGADGLLLVLPSRRGDARMRIFNPDGSEAGMCGNGLRCVAWYLHAMDGGKKSWAVETGAGLMRTQVVGSERTRIFLAPPKDLQLGLKAAVGGTRYTLHAVNSGVPHAVLLVSDLRKVGVASLGPAIRFHRIFQPAGTNVDWVRIDSLHRIALRTYERGVEGETLACGTGAAASVVVGAALGRLRPPVQVLTAGGETLTVGFRPGREPWGDLFLEGPARILFTGAISA
ncbi:MAG: diaminopimelate epimerase [Candidatus Omnitrophica bacterium]|nr:diaminopimelate epimerase [Candidatus Omnitrophota bacterium]